MQAGYNPPFNLVWSTGSTANPITVDAAGDYIVTVSNICSSSSDIATVTIKPCDIEVPNILSLSSVDGNNLFSVDYEGISKFECFILNRWGSVIYSYNDPAGSWDGKTQAGVLVEEGTYFYKINATFDGGIDVQKHGFVYVKY
jgi:hypothetical protein